ncbi:zinc-binding dehydrogenase [Leifsonia sp. TF02-11]|nr:zinc-binding dehydrogenase [Leifsonia sp. TF02-11]
MQGIGIEYYGEQPHLIDITLPDPDAGEIEVELFAASRNPLDEAVAAGYLAGLGEFRFPLVLGFDGAGVIRRVGSGVDRFAAGDRVFGQFWSTPMQFGTFAEATLAQARPALGVLRRIPDGVGFEAAAAAPTAGMTAAGALDNSGARPGDTILILGATGGVGTFAVQEAKARSIRVLAPASAEAADALRELGVNEVLPRNGALADALASPGAPEFAAILDFAGATDSVEVAAKKVRDGGTVVSTAYGVPEALRAQTRIVATDYVLDKKPARLDHVAGALAAGVTRPIIGHEMGLEDVAHGEAPARHGLRGKTVIRLQ